MTDYLTRLTCVGKAPAQFLRASLDTAVSKEPGAGQRLRPTAEQLTQY